MSALRLVLAALVVASTLGAVVPAASSDGPSDPPGPPGTDAPLAAAPGGVAQTQPTVLQGPIRVLDVQPNALNRSDVHEAYVDVGPAIGIATANASNRLGTLEAVERLRAVDEAERGAQLRNEVDRIERRADALAQVQRRALRAYVRNETTSTELLVRLARLDREARALEERNRRLSRLANRSDIAFDREQFDRLDRELGLYTGPVRARVAAALAGESPARRVYVAATPQGVVLSTLTDEAYLREAYRGDLRRPGEEELTPRDTLEAVASHYPEAWASRESATFDGGQIGRGQVEYAGGTLTAMVAGGNGRVFVDEHRQPLESAATSRTVVNTRDGLRLLVNRTYAGGPMRIELRDAGGNRVNANVTVGPEGGESASVGHTGADGVLWALPPGERFTVVAIRGQSVVFLTMDPLATPRAGEAATDANRTADNRIVPG